MSDDSCGGVAPTGSLTEAQADHLATQLKAIADPVRIRLLSVIAAAPSGEICACDLPAIFDRSQPTMSHHLSLLTQAGLIEREQRGKWAWFRVDADRVRQFHLDLEAVWATAATAAR